MADSEKIEYYDLISPDAESRLLDFISKVKAELASLGAKSVNELPSSSSRKPKLDDLNKEIELQKKLEQTMKGVTNLQKLEYEIQQKSSQNKKDYINAQKAENSEYEKLKQNVATYTKMAQEAAAKDISSTGQLSEKTKELIKTQNVHKNELNQINRALGNASDNVGFYGNKLTVLSKTLKGFGGLGRILGNALGIDTSAFDAIREAGLAVRDLTHAEEGEKLVQEGQTAATEAGTVAMEANTAATALGTAGITLLIAGFVAAGVAVYELVSAYKEEERQQKANLEVDKENLKIELELAKTRAKTSKEYFDSVVDEKVALKQITEAQGEKIKLGDEMDKKSKAIFYNETARIKELAKQYEVSEFSLNNPEKTANEQKFANEVFKIKEESKKQIAALNDEWDQKIDTIDVNSKTKQLKKEKKIEKEIKEGNHDTLAEYNKFVNQMMEDDDERLKHEKENLEEGELAWKAYMEDIHKIQQAEFEQTQKDAKKKRDDRIDQVLQTEEAILGGLKEGLSKREELQQASDQRMIDFHTRTAEIQATLAAGGKANTLGDEQAAAAQAEEKKIQDAKKAAKVQQTITLVETFSKVFAAAMKASDGSPGSFMKAFAQASAADGLVSAAFSKLFTGFYDGTESLGESDGVKIGEGKDNILIRAHKGERILGVDDSAAIAGLSNEEVRDASLMYMNGLYVPKTIFVDKKSEENAMLIQEVRALKEAFVSRPVHQSSLGRLNEWTDEINEGNMTTIIHHKPETFKSLRLR